MSYSSGMMNDRVTIFLPHREGTRTTYTIGPTVWCNVTWTKGAKALRQGAVDAYETVMIRTRFVSLISRWCRLGVNGKYYTIESLQADKRQNTCQMICTEINEFSAK